MLLWHPSGIPDDHAVNVIIVQSMPLGTRTRLSREKKKTCTYNHIHTTRLIRLIQFCRHMSACASVCPHLCRDIADMHTIAHIKMAYHNYLQLHHQHITPARPHPVWNQFRCGKGRKVTLQARPQSFIS